MIKESAPITLAEVADLAGDGEKEEKIKSFVKHFVKMPAEKARKMKEELKSLDLIKLKEAHIVKIIDFMPEDGTDLMKIVSGVSLDQEEVNKILEVVKKY